MILDVNVNQKLETIFNDFKVDDICFPIFPIKAPNNNFQNYLTYNTYAKKPELFGDDIPVAVVAYGTIDLYCSGNYLKVVTEIKKILIKNDFIWNGDGVPDYEEDTKLYHYPINFIKESGD